MIQKQKNLDSILDILQFEAQRNQTEALNTLGFLYYHGIAVSKSRSLAFEYFKNAALQQDMDANFACFCLSMEIGEKYDYFGHGILQNHPKTLGTLATLILNDKLENENVKDKITAYLNKASAEKGIPVSLRNFANNLRNGKGVSQNLDRAAEYFHRAMEAGYFEARKLLDEVYPNAPLFQQKFPEYSPWKAENYTDYYKQEIVLL